MINIKLEDDVVERWADTCPIDDNLLVLDLQTTEKGFNDGLYIPDSARVIWTGIVLKMGQEVKDKSKTTSLVSVSRGDVILFTKFSGVEYTRYKDLAIRIISRDDVYAVVEAELDMLFS
jgi:co-chaperonin GroES (HSP10)